MAEHIRRHWGLLALTVGVVLIFWVLYLLRSVLLPFILGVILAYVLHPLIVLAEKKLPGRGRWFGIRRITLILFFFILILTLLGLMVFFVITAVAASFSALLENVSDYTTAALETLQEWSSFLHEYAPPGVQLQIEEWIEDIGNAAGEAVRGFLVRTVALVPSTLGLVVGFAALPLFLFYALKDWEKLRDTFYSWLSPWAARHTANLLKIADDVLGRYLRAQLLLGFVVGLLALTGLLILQVGFAPVLGLFAGVTELIPTLGPWIGGITAVIVTLAVSPEKAFWVAVLFLAIQLLENTLLVPRIHSGYLHIHPALVVVLLVVGGYLAGFWGLVLAVPLTALFVEIVKYIHREIRTEDSKPKSRTVNRGG